MSVNLKTFPQLGAFPYEVGNSNSVGGINNMNGQWPMSLPLSYYWNFSTTKKRTKKSFIGRKFVKIRMLSLLLKRILKK